MLNKYFTKDEADALVGARIRTLVEFSGVPRGAAGTVSGIAKSGRNTNGSFLDGEDGYTVTIQWALPGRENPLVDWFNKTEFEKHLRALAKDAIVHAQEDLENGPK